MIHEEYMKKVQFVIDLGLALHECDVTSQRIERYLGNIVKHFGFNGSFHIVPTTITFVFWQNDKTKQYTYIARVKPGSSNLGLLADIDELVEKIAADNISLEEGKKELVRLKNQPGHYNTFFKALAWSAIGGSFAALLSSNWADVFCSSLLALIIFFLAHVKSTRISSTLEVLAPFISGVLVTGLLHFGLKVNVPFVILSSVIIFIPGLALTVALSEIANKDLVSGTARLVDSLMLLFKLYFGAVLGITVGGLLWGNSMNVIEGINNMPKGKTWFALFVLLLSLSVAFNIRMRQAHWGILSGLIAFSVSMFGEKHLGMAAGMFLGAFATGLYSNLFAIITKKPASIVQIQGIVLLVPGSKTYMILNDWVSGEQILTHSASSGSQAFMIFISLLVGILFSNALLPTNKSL